MQNARLPRYAYGSCRSLTSRVNAMPAGLQELVFDHLLDHLQSGIQSHIDSEIAWGDQRAGDAELPYPVFDKPHFMKRKFAHPEMIAALVERARYRIIRERNRTVIVHSNALLHFGTAHSRTFGVPLAGFYNWVYLSICPKDILENVRPDCKRLFEEDWKVIPGYVRNLIFTAAGPIEKVGGHLYIRAERPRWDCMPGTFDEERYKAMIRKVVEELESRKVAEIDFCWTWPEQNSYRAPASSRRKARFLEKFAVLSANATV